MDNHKTGLLQVINENLNQQKQAFPCNKCEKSFDREQQLRMHKMRVHTRAGQAGAMWKSLGRKRTHTEQLEHRREIQAKMRARNIARGLTGAGKVRQVPPRQSPRQSPRQTPRRIQYVYPLPQEAPLAPPEKPQVTDEMKNYLRAQMMKHCPNCGARLEAWNVETK
jgi:hypothetical protein